MADFGFSIAESLVEVTASRVIKEVCEIWDYESQLEELKQTVCTIRSVLFDAESQREELSHGARDYIANLKAVVYDADDLFDELNTLAELKRFDGSEELDDERFIKVRCFFCSKIKGVKETHRMLRGVKDIKKRLDDIANNHKKYGLRGDDGIPMNVVISRGPRREETCSYVGEKIIGRDADREEVIDMLGLNDVQESFRFVTIVGVGGLGKTTLAQFVYNNEKVQAEFPEFRLWVCVSDEGGQQFDVKLILCKILDLVSDQKLADTSPMELVNKQLQEKLGGRKYLLFLDDVWNEDPMKWRNLREFLTIGQKGSRIVVTTRSVKTAEVIGKRHIHTLKGLSDEDSWDLFESVAFNKEEQEHINNHPHPDLVHIGKKIVEKCYNIPLAIRAVGSLLNGEPVDKWQRIEKTIEQSGLAGIGKGENSIMHILKLSYDSLSPSLKSCFSYCALFPKDFSMMKEQLINLWMAQGYIVPFNSGETMEDAAEEHFMILLRKCFFQDVKNDEYGEIESVKMHDLMHDVALEVGREEIGVVSSNTTQLGDKVRHVYFAGHRDSFSQSYPFKSKIRSFIIGCRLGDMKDASVDSWMRVRVLVLKRAGIKRLPDSIGKLLHLRYLDLSNNDIVALPSCITTLHNLQTLDLNHCRKLRELPKKINKLVKLSYLYLFGCSELTNMPCMDKFTNLRYLDISYCQKLTNMPCMDKLTNLRHFDLNNCRELSSIPLGMDKLTNLRYLDLSWCVELSSMPRGMGKLSNLRVLTFFVVGMEKRVSSDGEEQCMGDLKDLKPLTSLEGSIEIKIGKYYVNADGEGGYLKGMKHLTMVRICFNDEYVYDNDGCIEWEGVIEKLEPPSNLKEFVLRGYEGTTIPRWGRAQDNWALSLPHLVEITLSDCKNLTQIPSLSILCNLELLTLRRLPKLEYMENKSGNHGNDLEDFTTFFPSLETLCIDELDSLKGWWREELVKVEDNDDLILKSSFTFPRLSELDIKKCPNLTSFPSCPSLKNIAMSDLDLLKSIDSQCLITFLEIEDNEKVESLSEFGDVFRKYTSSLRSLTIWYCSNLRRIGRGGLEHLTALEKLQFHANDQLSFSEDEINDEDMPGRSLPQSLHSLKFEWLENMKSLPKGMQYLTSLRSLSIGGCENISGLPEWISCLSSLQSLFISRCRAMKSLPESMRNLTSLQKLVINWCTDELKESCKQPNGKDWPNIQHIPNITIY